LLAGERELTSVPWFDTWEEEPITFGSSATPESVVFFPSIDFGDGQLTLTTWNWA